MSKITEFRDRVVNVLKEQVQGLQEVEWYDGLFDEKDINEWSLRTPCAMVAVRRAPASNHSTGELNIPLRVHAVVITQDSRVPRDADAACWDLIEEIAVLANLNNFGDPNAGYSSDVRFERLQDPELRREGIAVGLAEWTTTLTIGRNMTAEHEYVYDPATGERVVQTPRDLFLGRAVKLRGVPVNETVNLTPSED